MPAIGLLLACNILLVGCDEDGEQPKHFPPLNIEELAAAKARYAEDNPTRQSLGIREIKEEWNVVRHHSGQYRFHLPEDCDVIKTVHVADNGRPELEIDYYYTGEKYPLPNAGEFGFERLSIRYDYGLNRVEIYYSGKDREVKRIISQAQADVPNSKRIQLADEALQLLELERL